MCNRFKNFLCFGNLSSPKSISLKEIERFISDEATKRIHFATLHSNALHSDDDGTVWLNLPFQEPFESIAKSELGINKVLFQNKNNKWYRILKDDELDGFIKLIDDFGELVLLRDCLDLSIALCMHENVTEDGEARRTVLGEHEYQLKYNSDKHDTSADLKALTEELQRRLDSLPFFRHADYIMAVPSSRPFMVDIINGLDGFDFTDISDKVSWINKQGSLKELDDPKKKLELIDTWGLKIDQDTDLKGKTVLLVDDMYKSGITMQYVAMKLKEAGARRVFGICLCKALGND